MSTSDTKLPVFQVRHDGVAVFPQNESTLIQTELEDGSTEVGRVTQSGNLKIIGERIQDCIIQKLDKKGDVIAEYQGCYEPPALTVYTPEFLAGRARKKAEREAKEAAKQAKQQEATQARKSVVTVW